MRQQAVHMLSTEVDIVEEHHFVCSEEPLLSMTLATAAAAATAATAEGGGSDVTRKAAVDDLTVIRLHDLLLGDVLGPPQGLQHLVSYPSKEAYTVLPLLASASTCRVGVVLRKSFSRLAVPHCLVGLL